MKSNPSTMYLHRSNAYQSVYITPASSADHVCTQHMKRRNHTDSTALNDSQYKT